MDKSEPMRDDLPPIEWVKEGVKRLVAEIECVDRHVNDGVRDEDGSDYVDAALHLSSVVEGVKMVTKVLIEEILDMEERAIVASTIIQQKFGVPTRVEIINGLPVVVQEEVVVPDSLEGFDGR